MVFRRVLERKETEPGGEHRVLTRPMKDGQDAAAEAYTERRFHGKPEEAWGADWGASLAEGAGDAGGWSRDHKGNLKVTQWTPGHGPGHNMV